MGETLIVGLIGAAVSAVGAISQGSAQASAANAQRQQYEEEQQTALLAADQDEVQRRQSLARVLATQQAVRAGQGVDIYSGTGLALRDTSINEANTDIATSRLNYESQAHRFGLAADAAGQSASNAMFGGLLSAGGDLAVSGVKVYDYLDAKGH